MAEETPANPANPKALTLQDSSLRLDERQSRRLLDFVNTELDDYCQKMGRGKDGLTEPGSWLDKRRLNQLWYEGDLKWRTSEGGDYLGGVFNDSNFTRGDGKRYVRHMAAKVCDDLIGTAPYFATLKKPNGNAGVKASLIKAVEDFAQDGVEQSNFSTALREAVELALVRNEAVIKLRNVFAATSYLGPADVLVDAGGQPVITPGKQLYVFQNDDFVPLQEQPGMLALVKDPTFIVGQDAQAAFQYQHFDDLPQTQVTKDGLDARVLDPRDFICRLDIDDIHDSPLVAHLYDESPGVLRTMYGGFDSTAGYFSPAESGAKAPIESQGEQPSSGINDDWVHVAEVYVRFDADEDGREEEIVLILDRCDNGGRIVFVDYAFKHFKRRPFEVLHGLRKVPSRWYGVGIYTDKFDQLIFCDKCFNKINLKNSKTCTVTAVRRDAVEEWSDLKAPIVFGGDEVLSLTNKWSDDRGDFVKQYRLVEVGAEEIELMQQMLQAMDQEFGYISAADASATGLNQSKTATGIASIERSGNNIVKAVERIAADGIKLSLVQAIEILLEHMDPLVLALNKNAELLSLNRDEIRNLPRNVRLLLTRSRSSELLATNAQATQKANEFFDILDAAPRRARALRGMYIEQLRALEVQDADEILPEVTDEMITAWESAKANAGKAEEPRESISISYKDLLPSERAQALQRLGITPAPPEEVQQAEQQRAEAEAAKIVNVAGAKSPQPQAKAA